MSNPEIQGRFPTISDIVLAVAAALRHSSPEKHGELRASKAAIEAMPRVPVTAEESDKACSICLEEFEVGGEAREMPCKHKFHSSCIENWLRVKGLCPLCRFVMPMEEEEEGRESMDEEEEEEGRESMDVVYHQHVEEEGGRESMDVVDHQQEEEGGRENIHQHEFWVHFVVVDSSMDSGSDLVEVEVEVEDDDSSTQDMV
ncbi:hypothetical protein RGQ29_017683 [Quercus rubra]|uniref:RING-type E3 ubiquitin transferase n=1 Tax=Quercus rubra TaxID=3512 RepID=A0AAN7FNC6_QUERU|nr:hypothetical protein RGQ29_017683 [Quercus rubra]